MLGKLIKYEFKACGRTFFPIYISILVLASINGLFNNYNIFNINMEGGGTSLNFSIDDVKGIFMLVLVALFVALFVITIVLTIQRFKKSLLEDEGYLMFTLPVSTKNLILSKYLVALIFVVLSTLIGIASFIIVGLFSGGIGFSDLANMFSQDIFVGYDSSAEFWRFAIFSIIYLLLMYSIFIFTVYLAISVGQFPQFNKHRVAAGVVAFFIINMIVNYLQGFISKYLGLNNVAYDGVTGVASNISTIFFEWYDLIALILNLLILVLLFMGTNWILNKKLNLE